MKYRYKSILKGLGSILEIFPTNRFRKYRKIKTEKPIQKYWEKCGAYLSDATVAYSNIIRKKNCHISIIHDSWLLGELRKETSKFYAKGAQYNAQKKEKKNSEDTGYNPKSDESIEEYTHH